jgi:prepilin-type N-terminal cleavage/methylation domain-containing protein
MTRFAVRTAPGFTLMEVMVVVLLSAVATLGMVGFYLNSQAMWLDASTQALAQRDATMLLEVLRYEVQEAASAQVLPSSPDSLNHLVILYDASNNERDRFYWDPADSLVHHDEAGGGSGPVVSTIVERFHVTLDGALPLLAVDTLRVRSTSGQHVQMSTTIGFYNSAP